MKKRGKNQRVMIIALMEAIPHLKVIVRIFKRQTQYNAKLNSIKNLIITNLERLIRKWTLNGIQI